MSAQLGDLERLALQLRGNTVACGPRRFANRSAPDRSPPGRFAFAGCAAGNLAAVREDVGDALAGRILAAADAEPAWAEGERLPGCVGPILRLLSLKTPLEAIRFGPVYALPNGTIYPTDASIVRGEDAEGAALLAGFAANGVPVSLKAAGFVDITHFWPPWCAALVGDEIAAMAFTVHLSEAAAEIGVYTFAGFRGRGLAAAVTAAWSALPSLSGRALFYSTQWTNASSRRVTARLDLRQIGASLSIG